MIQQTCPTSGQTFQITDEDKTFYKKMGLDLPTLCPDERCRRRLGWQNMRKLYRRKCDATGQIIISNISADKPLKVYKQEHWWSDKWDFRDYGRDFDFSRGFFEQWHELFLEVPQPCMLRNFWLDENCDFTNYAGNNKNCYLIFHADMNEDTCYGVGVKKCTSCTDVMHCHGSELLYECVDCRNGYDLKFSQNCENCSGSWFLKNCVGCKNCFGCVNLRNKEYHYLNEPMKKEDYEVKIKSLQLHKHSSLDKMRKEFGNFVKTFPQRATEGHQNEACSGDQIFRCKNTQDCFDIQESRDMRYCHRVYNGPNSDCFDVNEYGMQIQKVCEGLAIGINAHNVIVGIYVNEQVSDIYYGMHNHHSQNCFGCIGAVRAKHCILNKQYTEEEYKALVPRIIEHMKKNGEWGEFFPLELSPFGYNETVATEYFPLSEEEALAKGYKWAEEEATSKYLSEAYKIPDSIHEVDESIVEQILTCEETGKNYKIQRMELNFYKKMELPIPRMHPDYRHEARTKARNPRHLWNKKCAQCLNEIQTTYDPDRPEKVLCEECYLKITD